MAATPTEAPTRWHAYAFYGALQAGDLVSTEIMLAGGGREVNGLLQTRAVRVALKALVVPALAELDRDLMSRGPKGKRVAWIARVVVGVLYAYLIVRNLRIAGSH